MFSLILLACVAPDPSPWLGTWFGTVDWWTGDVDHWRTVWIDISATDETKVPVEAVGTFHAAHEKVAVSCDGIAGGEEHHEGLVLICDVEGHPDPVLLDLYGIDENNPDHVDGQAAEVPADADVPPLNARHYEDWSDLAAESCIWFTPHCTVSLDRALDGMEEPSLESSALVNRADVACTDDLGPWPTFRGEVEPSVTGTLLEFAAHGELVFLMGLEPDESGRLSWDGYPMGGTSDTCADITTTMYAATGPQFQELERIDL